MPEDQDLPGPVAADGPANLPKLVRFLAQEGPSKGQICYGQVVDTNGDGVPTAVRPLLGTEGPLCDPTDPARGTPLPETVGAYVQRLNAALRALADGKVGEEEPIADRRHILAPVRADLAWLECEEIVVAAIGINYPGHSKETGRDEPIAFNKFAEPTPPYRDVKQVERLPKGSGKAVPLLDHEVEIAFVALEPIPLDEVPPNDLLARKIAFLAVDDVSDREPIILDQETGYTEGKGRPGFLPAGPWLVPGRRLWPQTKTSDGETLILQLEVVHGGVRQPRQRGVSAAMMLGLREILVELGSRNEATAPAGKVVAMEDADGVRRRIVPGNVLPAGSIVLTGTPEGTAIKEPHLLEKLKLFIEGGFSREGAARKYVKKQIEKAEERGYLQVGDTVDQAITGLGRQVWKVVEDRTLR
jgi:2-keto-4-pentenoate hydratase/2-oxohepta-3-ene-1,7-dioic acid hydratase in catechol pathway